MRIYKHREFNSEDLQQGDIRVTQSMDAVGRYNRDHKNTNYGFSGRILIFIYDGTRWAWLRKKDKPKLSRVFSYQYESRELVDRVIEHFQNSCSIQGFNFWWYKGKRFAAIKRKDNLEDSLLHNS